MAIRAATLAVLTVHLAARHHPYDWVRWVIPVVAVPVFVFVGVWTVRNRRRRRGP
ncbi:MAG: hypothetical protein JO265_10470 [Acidimicrobiia bacterium]|nr:hypothetical protein [Acidimicrobiia bacterium]